MFQLKYEVCQVRAKTLEKLYVFPTFGLPTALNMPSDFIQVIKHAEKLFSLQIIFMAMLLYFCFPYKTLTAKLQPIEPYKNRENLYPLQKEWVIPMVKKCISTNLPIFYRILHELETINYPFSNHYLYN